MLKVRFPSCRLSDSPPLLCYTSLYELYSLFGSYVGETSACAGCSIGVCAGCSVGLICLLVNTRARTLHKRNVLVANSCNFLFIGKKKKKPEQIVICSTFPILALILSYLGFALFHASIIFFSVPRENSEISV